MKLKYQKGIAFWPTRYTIGELITVDREKSRKRETCKHG